MGVQRAGGRPPSFEEKVCAHLLGRLICGVELREGQLILQFDNGSGLTLNAGGFVEEFADDVRES